ncbi:CLUMA_CG015627, isoform A [Clunio marinus]|uniref:CLUMA_CG015627, isoform A n=1 Tax=Clunio marinus TaxID=568069 RepID=A0A1J1IPF3_9DIPT|nr:CLUMA_CG015627, isoform A [Clunio marinus]
MITNLHDKTCPRVLSSTSTSSSFYSASNASINIKHFVAFRVRSILLLTDSFASWISHHKRSEFRNMRSQIQQGNIRQIFLGPLVAVVVVVKSQLCDEISQLTLSR